MFKSIITVALTAAIATTALVSGSQQAEAGRKQCTIAAFHQFGGVAVAGIAKRRRGLKPNGTGSCAKPPQILEWPRSAVAKRPGV